MIRRFAHVVLVLGIGLFGFGCGDGSGPTGTDPSDPTDPGDDGSTTAFNSEAPPGDAAQAFLDDRSFTVLRLEVDFMEGHEPTAEALNSLKAELDAHLSKTSINIGPVSRIPAQGRSAYSSQQIRDLEAQHRDHYTRAESDTLQAYFLVVDGEYTEANVLGIAYYNTSMAFFGETIRSISGGVTQPSREKVEATVFRHEVGHNLGLVNNGTPMQQDHQDDGNGRHCTNQQCVMYYSIETTDYFSNLFDGTIPEFEQFCSEDMQAQGGQ